MTPVFCCGFECGQLGSVGQHFSNGTGFSISTSTVRSGARSLRCLDIASGSYTTISYSPSFIRGSVARCYFYFATLPNVDVDLMFMEASGTQSGSARFVTSDSKIYARTNTNGSAGVSVTTGQWYLVEMKYDVSANPNLCDVMVNGVACGQSSQSAIAESINDFRICMPTANSTLDIYVDDFVLSNTFGDYPIGAGKVEHFVPTADGTHNIAGANDYERTLTGTDILNSTTDSYLLIDDVPLESSAGDFINMTAPTDNSYVENVFGPAPGISTPTVAPRAVEVIAAIHQAGTGAGNMNILLNDNGTTGTVYTATGVAGTTTLAYKRAHFATAPTGGAWTVVSGAGNFNNIKSRFGATATVDANPDQYLDGIMIEAEFEEIAIIPAIPNKIYNYNQAVKRAAYW